MEQPFANEADCLHRLTTPLTVALIQVEMLLRELGQEPKARERLEKTQTALQKMQIMLNQRRSELLSSKA